MVTETLADKIQRIGNRLAEIARERQATHPGGFTRRGELLYEEHTLQKSSANLRTRP